MPIRPRQTSGWPLVGGGIRKKINPFVGEKGFWKLENLHLDEMGALTKWAGFQKYNSVQLLEAAVGATFTGLFDYVQADGTRHPMATGLTGLYRFGNPSANTWNAISLANAGGDRTITADSLAWWIVLRDILYVFNGADSNVKFNATAAFNMGIAAPGSAPSGSAVTGTGLNIGAYSYKVTFYNSSLAHESNPSVKSSDITTTSGNQQIDLTGIPTSTDAQVDRRRIYRTAVGGGIWLFHSEIADNTTTTLSDTTPDSSLGIQVEEFAHGVPPISKFAEVYKGHVFMVPKNSSRIHFSKQNFPNAVHANDFRDLDPDDGDIVTGIKRLFGQVIAFKNDSIWNGTGDDRDTFQFTRQVTGVGSVNNHGILTIPGQNRLIFPSENGFYSYDGISEQYKSVHIESVYRGLNQSRLNLMVGFPYKPKNMLIWLAHNGASVQGDTMIVYDYIQDQWSTRPVPNTKSNIATIIEDSSNNELFYIGGYGGYAWQGDVGLSDDGSAISCEVIDRALPRPDKFPESEKVFNELIVWFKTQASVTMTVSYALDDPENAYTSPGTIDMSNATGQDRLRFNATGRRIFFKFVNSATGQPVILRGWKCFYRTLGRVRG